MWFLALTLSFPATTHPNMFFVQWVHFLEPTIFPLRRISKTNSDPKIISHSLGLINSHLKEESILSNLNPHIHQNPEGICEVTLFKMKAFTSNAHSKNGDPTTKSTQPLV
ncbi:hypothetical protein TNCV_3334751 [Trichonephila clavipes]|nr:hypothetical protein TNCV_3334751 [Trichonephila clavipes]